MWRGEFAAASVRAATHRRPGAPYHADRRALEKYLDGACLETAARANGHSLPGGQARMRALVAPHIDPWRGAVGYGHAYGALGASLAKDVDTFVLLGTSHAPMREPFALCRKAFDTPLGAVEADFDALDALASGADFDCYADQFNHKREHSLEFQVVFLKHLLKDRPFRIVPVLAGLGAQQASGSDPLGDARITRRSWTGCARSWRPARGAWSSSPGADMARWAQVPATRGRMTTRSPRGSSSSAIGRRSTTRRRSTGRASGRTSSPTWKSRRVCGLAPIWALVHARSVGAAPGGRCCTTSRTSTRRTGRS